MLTKIVRIAVCLCAAFAMVGVSAGNDNINDESPLETEGDEEMSLIVIENYDSEWDDIGTFDLSSDKIVLIVEGEEPIDEDLEEELVEDESEEELTEEELEEESIEENLVEEEVVAENATSENTTSENTANENTTSKNVTSENTTSESAKTETETKAETAAESETKAVNTFSDSDKSMLLRIGMAEAGSESLTCVASVMRVILNRVDSSEFPNNIHDVIYQANQFVPVSSGSFESVKPNEKCYEAYDMIVNGWNETYGALYFESCSGSSWHSRNLTLLYTDGNMRFYK